MWIGLERARVTRAFLEWNLLLWEFLTSLFFLYELDKSVTFSEINCWCHFLEVPWLLGCQAVPVWRWIRSGSCRSLLALWSHWELLLAFGRTEHHPELLRVHKENHLSFSMVQCALTVRLAPLLTKGEMGQQRKMLAPVPHFTFTSWKHGAVQRLRDEETQLPPCTVPLCSHLHYLFLSLSLFAWRTVMPHGCRALCPRGI